MKKVIILLFLNIVILLHSQEYQTTNEVSLLSFNIQVFGKTKSNKPEVMHVISDIVTQFHIIAIQEVRDKSGTTAPKLMELLPDYYDFIIGPREGRTNSKEQFLYLYDSTKVDVLGQVVYEDVDDVYERNPMGLYLKVGELDFVLINLHIKPDDKDTKSINETYDEISVLPMVIESFSTFFNEPDIAIVGDFNEDGSYFNEELLSEIFNESQYINVIHNDLNTTVAKSSNTYDRIILTDDMSTDWAGEYGVLYFDEVYDLGDLEPKKISDHYPVWCTLNINFDND